MVAILHFWQLVALRLYLQQGMNLIFNMVQPVGSSPTLAKLARLTRTVGRRNR